MKTSSRLHHLSPLLILAALAVFASISSAQEETAAPPVPIEHVRPKERLTPRTMPAFLEAVRAKYNLPALGAAIIYQDRISVTTVGVRKFGDSTPVTDEDGWHLGSCTKSMTATVLAMLVDEGKLSWQSTLPEMLPELADSMLPEFKTVTLAQILSHRAGLKRDVLPPGEKADYWSRDTDAIKKQRLDYARASLTQAPLYPPGTQMVYSNAGYVIAGAIMEHATGQTWEDAMQERLFKPLGMNTVTYGTRNDDQLLEPFPHYQKDDQPVAVKPGQNRDMPNVIGPAGLVRCSLSDWGTYIRFWMNGLRGQTQLIRAEDFRFLATAPDPLTDKGGTRGDGYAYGWRTGKRSWSKGPIYYHSGTNRRNFCNFWMAPTENFAVLIVMNREATPGASDDVAIACLSELSRLSRQ